MSKYMRFGAMILTSTVVMFGLMYLNVYSADHIYWSQTRAYMALIMGATMAIIMLAFMLGMYSNAKANLAIFLGSVVVFAVAPLPRPQPGHRRGRRLDEGDDPAPLHRDPHQ